LYRVTPFLEVLEHPKPIQFLTIVAPFHSVYTAKPFRYSHVVLDGQSKCLAPSKTETHNHMTGLCHEAHKHARCELSGGDEVA